MSSRRASIFTKLVVLGLIVYSAITLIGLRSQIEDARDTKAALQETVNDLTYENATYEYEIENKDDPDTIERIARNKYGLVMPGERIYYGIIN